MATRTIRKMKVVGKTTAEPEPAVIPPPEEEVCPHCERTATECEAGAKGVHNKITHWMGDGLTCDDCHYERFPKEGKEDDEEEESEAESSEEEKESVRSEEEEVSEPESEDAECQTEPLPVTAVGVSERRVYGIVDDQISQMEETLEEKLADMRRQMMADMERMMAEKIATLTLAQGKPSKKAEKEKKKQEEEVRGYYEVTNWQEEASRLRSINRELRKESEGKTNTNRKLQEKIDNLESEDPVAQYVAEIKKVREVNQVLRKRCEAKDRTYQKMTAEIKKMKAMIEALGGKAPEQGNYEDDE